VAGMEVTNNASSSVLHSRSRTNCDSVVDDESRQMSTAACDSGGCSALKQSMHGFGPTPHYANDHRPVRYYIFITKHLLIVPEFREMLIGMLMFGETWIT